MSTPTTTPTKTIEVTVSPEGAVSIKTAGFAGGSCRDATRDLERALGASGIEHLLPEYFQRASTGQQLQQGS
jgi:hypothetical protein